MTTPFGRSNDLQSPVSLTKRLADSRFRALYREGMTLVEDVAAYLDGPGRIEAKAFDRTMAMAYAAESMRLTTRLMQIASWLLVQKAINEGDLDRAQGILEKNRVQVTSQGIASPAAVFAELPDRLQDFTARSLQIQTRILQSDAKLRPDEAAPPLPDGLGVHGQFDLLRRTYCAA